MILTQRTRDRFRTGILFNLLALVACGDDEASAPEPELAVMHLITGTQVVTVSNEGTVTGGPLLIPLGTTWLNLDFLDRTGNPDPLVTAATFEARVIGSPPTVLTANRSQAFGFTLTGVAEGSANLSAGLFHLAEGHSDFGPFDVPVTVEAGP